MTTKYDAEILEVIGKEDPPPAVPVISLGMRSPPSDSTLYTILKRLQGEGKVIRREEDVVLLGRTLRRVTWSLPQPPHKSESEPRKA